MSSEPDERTSRRGLRTAIPRRIGTGWLVPVFVGVLAGYSASLLGEDVVVFPVLGPAPGTAVGVVGLAAAVVVYRRVGCCGGCSGRLFGIGGRCGCSGECGDSCSYEP